MAGWLRPNCWFKLSRELDSYLDLTPAWISWLICKPLPVKEAAFVCEEGGDDLWSCYPSSRSQWPSQPGHKALSVTFHLPRLWLLQTTCSHHWLSSHSPREMPVWWWRVVAVSRVWLLNIFRRMRQDVSSLYFPSCSYQINIGKTELWAWRFTWQQAHP